MNITKSMAGVDIAKCVFQIHEVDVHTGEIVSVQLKREKFLEHFANRAVCLIGMEACRGAQHWARRLIALGHTVKLPPAKTEAQQAVLAMHRMRQQLMKFRTAQINALRGLLTEYSEVMSQGRHAITKALPDVLGRLIERRLQERHRQDEACRRIAEIPGIGLLTATAAVATVGDPEAFQSGRECRLAWPSAVPDGHRWPSEAAWVSASAAIPICVCCRSTVPAPCSHNKAPPEWATNLIKRRPVNVAVVMANRSDRDPLSLHGSTGFEPSRK